MQTNQIIQSLIDHQIVSINLQKPFRYASGILSPIYTDFRLTISIPDLRRMIADGLAENIKENYPEATVIGGVATAGIPHAAWVAERLNLPLIYVRAKPKDHGAGKQIEGRINQDDKVVLIDDLISTGGSVLGAVKAVRNEGVNVIGVASVFTYGLPDADKNFAAANTKLVPLLSYADLIKQGHQENKFSDEEYSRLSTWHKAPWDWTKREEAHAN
ncbi:orotate phosphoribosyltransferase [Lentilactobacillus fungorum]|uniref:Orotate phosphoribosyltransferase n=1 Tax=Lentilactobacillus fungorum TaxID=2201250 RepID=A0ABQ3W3N1_9LACO|nr:orotate phosphoribosyltransferase [Lentilactobacillus fungorum]GHP14941.1 orotate phosphoribosyltransferase [Lentilactobacillus fungorum]